MSWIKKITDAIVGSEDFSDIKSSSVRDILNGNILTKRFIQKQYGLIFMIAVLAFLYVDNRFYCETQLAKEIDLKKKIQDFMVGYGKDEREKEILKNMYRLAGFRASTDAQLLPIRQLELFKDRLKYENDVNMAESDKKVKLAEIDSKLAELAKQMK